VEADLTKRKKTDENTIKQISSASIVPTITIAQSAPLSVAKEAGVTTLSGRKSAKPLRYGHNPEEEVD
jgi:hypothetical protein